MKAELAAKLFAHQGRGACKEILAVRNGDSEPWEAPLSIVLASTLDNNVEGYVTWVYNHQTDEFVWGHYFTRHDDAYDDFCSRHRH